jgi:hypothetical protein
MSGASLPSGVLKVAEECERLVVNYCQAVLNCSERATDQNVKAVVSAENALHAAIDQLAALASPPPQATGALSEEAEQEGFEVWFEQYRMQTWISSGCDKDRGPQPSAAWGLGSRQSLLRGWLARAALSSAKREAEPLTDAKVIAMNPYLNDEGRRALWLAAFRMAEKHHGITTASQVEPEDKP